MSDWDKSLETNVLQFHITYARLADRLHLLSEITKRRPPTIDEIVSFDSDHKDCDLGDVKDMVSMDT